MKGFFSLMQGKGYFIRKKLWFFGMGWRSRGRTGKSLSPGMVSTSGQMCSVGSLVIQIIPECTGVFEIIVFSAVLLAYLAPWGKKLLGIVAGLAILTFLNLLRLLILGVIGFSNQEVMEWIHLYLWQLTPIALVVGLFFAWLAWIQPKKAIPLLSNSSDEQ